MKPYAENWIGGAIAITVFSGFVSICIRDIVITSRRWKQLASAYPIGSRALPSQQHKMWRIFLGGWRHPFQNIGFSWESDGIFLIPDSASQFIGFAPIYIPNTEFSIRFERSFLLFGKSVIVTPKSHGCAAIAMPLKVWQKSGAAALPDGGRERL